jgi:hypothetical protein
LILAFLGIITPIAVYSQNQYFNFGRFNFLLASKILKDGSITDPAFGGRYTDRSAGSLRFRLSAFDSTQLNSAPPVQSSRQYLILTAKLAR